MSSTAPGPGHEPQHLLDSDSSELFRVSEEITQLVSQCCTSGPGDTKREWLKHAGSSSRKDKDKDLDAAAMLYADSEPYDAFRRLMSDSLEEHKNARIVKMELETLQKESSELQQMIEYEMEQTGNFVQMERYLESRALRFQKINQSVVSWLAESTRMRDDIDARVKFMSDKTKESEAPQQSPKNQRRRKTPSGGSQRVSRRQQRRHRRRRQLKREGGADADADFDAILAQEAEYSGDDDDADPALSYYIDDDDATPTDVLSDTSFTRARLAGIMDGESTPTVSRTPGSPGSLARGTRRKRGTMTPASASLSRIIKAPSTLKGRKSASRRRQLRISGRTATLTPVIGRPHRRTTHGPGSASASTSRRTTLTSSEAPRELLSEFNSESKTGIGMPRTVSGGAIQTRLRRRIRKARSSGKKKNQASSSSRARLRLEALHLEKEGVVVRAAVATSTAATSVGHTAVSSPRHQHQQGEDEDFSSMSLPPRRVKKRHQSHTLPKKKKVKGQKKKSKVKGVKGAGVTPQQSQQHLEVKKGKVKVEQRSSTDGTEDDYLSLSSDDDDTLHLEGSDDEK